MTRVTPNQPKTPLRSFRVPDDLWMPARDKAHREGITITDVLQRALREYLGADTQTPPTPKRRKRPSLLLVLSCARRCPTRRP